jgi:hypothetical protein
MRDYDPNVTYWANMRCLLIAAGMLLGALLLACVAARADTVDYLLTYATTAAAQADPALAAYGSVDPDTNAWTWRGDVVIAGVQVWDTRQDVTSTNPSPPPATITTHTYQSGFWMIVSTQGRVAALDADAATQLVADRSMAIAGNPGFILYSTEPAVDLQYFMLAPTFADVVAYPFGTTIP